MAIPRFLTGNPLISDSKMLSNMRLSGTDRSPSDAAESNGRSETMASHGADQCSQHSVSDGAREIPRPPVVSQPLGRSGAFRVVCLAASLRQPFLREGRHQTSQVFLLS